MRARMALLVSQQQCHIREVVLRDKPPSLLAYSPKGTVPVLVLADETVVDESLDIMRWALERSDPDSWLTPKNEDIAAVFAIIAACDGDFKANLDRYKYATRYEGADPLAHRTKAEAFLLVLDQRLQTTTFLFGDRRCLADIAIAPFVRQFANADRAWFDNTPYPSLQRWLSDFLSSDLFARCMVKNNQWQPDPAPTLFPLIVEQTK